MNSNWCQLKTILLLDITLNSAIQGLQKSFINMNFHHLNFEVNLLNGFLIINQWEIRLRVQTTRNRSHRQYSEPKLLIIDRR